MNKNNQILLIMQKFILKNKVDGLNLNKDYLKNI